MTVDTQQCAFAPQPKGESAAAARDARRRDLERRDREGSDEVRKRSGGRCELPGCTRRADQVHHLLGGHGRRGRVSEESHLAINKVHVCMWCHQDVTGHVVRLWWSHVADRFGSLRVE